MTTPTPPHGPETGLTRPRFATGRIRDLAAEGRPALLGCSGAALITLGGLGAGSTRLHDPLLESLHLSWLRFGHGLVFSSVLLWAVWRDADRVAVAGPARDRPLGATEYTMVATTGFWLTPLLLSVPVFSRDTYSYLAQGALLRDGFDPYVVRPIENPNPLLDNVSPIWTTTTAPYGPAFILVAKFVTMVVGNNVIAGTMLLRLCMLPGLVMLIWAAPRVARHVGANGPAALWICVLNPLVIIHLMGGVHNEMLMVGLMMAGIALTFEDRPVWGVGLIAIAVAVKATAGIALPFMVWVWMRQLRDTPRYRAPRRPSAWPRRVDADLRRGVRRPVLAGGRRARVADGAGGFGEDHQLADRADRGRQPDQRRRRPVLPRQLLRGARGHPHRRHRDHRDLTSAAVVAVPTRRPGSADGHRAGDARRGAVRARGPALVLHLAAGGGVRAGAVTPRDRVIAGFSTWIMVIFKPDGSHGMYSWLHVLLATRMRSGGVVLAARIASRASDRRSRRSRSVGHRLRAAQHLAGLVGVQGVDRAGVGSRLGRTVAADRQRRVGREQPPHDLGLAGSRRRAARPAGRAGS